MLNARKRERRQQRPERRSKKPFIEEESITTRYKKCFRERQAGASRGRSGGEGRIVQQLYTASVYEDWLQGGGE